jgi:hypothetical protein
MTTTTTTTLNGLLRLMALSALFSYPRPNFKLHFCNYDIFYLHEPYPVL